MAVISNNYATLCYFSCFAVRSLLGGGQVRRFGMDQVAFSCVFRYVY